MEQVRQPATYQVFINYRGPDTQRSLASFIYRTLRNHGLRVFMYVEEIQARDAITSAIRRAISSASVHIALFSERYAESHWVLDELCLILGSSHQRKFIPVFWNVEPADLRDIESRCYAKIFQTHERRGRYPMEVVKIWKAALREAAEISGYILKSNESDEEKDLNIVKIVLQVVESLQPGIYQVFINHRGPDAKLTHASLIYYSLMQRGLRVFLDEKEFRKGDILDPAIERAIHSASVNTIIFSKKYADSYWCLVELCLILKSFEEGRSTIVAIFLDVEPTDLRYIEKGCYAEAFQKHVERNGRLVDKRKEALKKAADISGFIVKTNVSDYGLIYLEQIVKTVFREVKEREPLEVATHPVGLDKAVEDFQNQALNQSGTKIVGIAGMGGLGKSTLAKHFYDKKRLNYTRSCFLFDVRERYLPSMQEELIRDLLDHDLRIDNIIEGKAILQRSLPGVHAMIVLDDVDDIEQINSLLDMDAVGPYSLILLTSRDKDLLKRSSPKALLYDVKLLNSQHAQELFCRHAFLQSEPVQGFEDLAAQFLEICGGLPSSLKALGLHLAGNRDKAYWKRQVETFSKRLPDDIINKLKPCYETLKKEEKEMFLDVGCFLVGEDRELAVRVLEGLGYYDARDCLESLHHKCLINYKDQHPEFRRLTMHNQVKGLARHIAKEEFFDFAKHKPLRLSCSSDITEVFQLQDGSESCLTRGIRIPKDQNPP